MARKNITNAIFLSKKNANSNWSFEAAFVDYMWMYLQNATSMCKC